MGYVSHAVLEQRAIAMIDRRIQDDKTTSEQRARLWLRRRRVFDVPNEPLPTVKEINAIMRG